MITIIEGNYAKFNEAMTSLTIHSLCGNPLVINGNYAVSKDGYTTATRWVPVHGEVEFTNLEDGRSEIMFDSGEYEFLVWVKEVQFS